MIQCMKKSIQQLKNFNLFDFISLNVYQATKWSSQSRDANFIYDCASIHTPLSGEWFLSAKRNEGGWFEMVLVICQIQLHSLAAPIATPLAKPSSVLVDAHRKVSCFLGYERTLAILSSVVTDIERRTASAENSMVVYLKWKQTKTLLRWHFLRVHIVARLFVGITV